MRDVLTKQSNHLCLFIALLLLMLQYMLRCYFVSGLLGRQYSILAVYLNNHYSKKKNHLKLRYLFSVRFEKNMKTKNC